MASQNFLDTLDQLKTASHEAGEKVSSASLRNIRARFDEAQRRIQEQLDRCLEPDASEAEVLYRALRVADIEPVLQGAFSEYTRAILADRVVYYDSARHLLLRAFDDDFRGVVRLDPTTAGTGKTGREYQTITDHTFGIPLETRARRILVKLQWRLEDIAAETLRPTSGAMRDFRAEYRDAVAGAFNAAYNSLRGLSNDMTAAVYEQLANRLMASLKPEPR